jgi:hypothetical protein
MGSRNTRWLFAALALWALVVVSVFAPPQPSHSAPPQPQQLDPAAWGSDHVGQPVPEYVDSGECLFCHKGEVGASWQTNKHNRTVRPAEAGDPGLAALAADPATKALAGDVQLVIGDTRAERFLKRSAAYGKLEMLSPFASFGRGKRARLEATDNPRWDSEVFALECAGCHTTGVDPESHAFSAPYLDCFACHGEAPAEHANDSKLMPLAKARKDSPAVVTSICGSCHIRFGKSKATGLPYPTNFVAGDNLFKDYEVDWT